MKLPVPYYSQFTDIQDPFWMLRACGAVSLIMIAEFHGREAPEIISFCNEAKEKGGYDMKNGWVHDYLVAKAEDFGLQAYRKEGLSNVDEIKISLDRGNPVIVSVEKRVLEQTRFHMVVLVGYEDESLDSQSSSSSGPYFIYHEPESTDKEKGQNRVCSQDVFMKYWRGKAIFISK